MKKILYICSLSIPIGMIDFLITEMPTLSIPEIGVFLGWKSIFLLYTSFIIVWFCCCSSIRKSCRNRGWKTLTYHFVPTGVFSVIFLAQWHFFLAVIIVTLMLALQIAFFLKTRNLERTHRYSEKRHCKYKRTNQRFLVLSIAVFCFIPFCMITFVYELKSPSYTAEQEVWETLSEDDAKEPLSEDDKYKENINLFKFFDEEKWSKLNIHEKITVAQKLVDFESDQLGIPAICISTKRLSSFTLGGYDRNKNIIVIDIKHLANSSGEECIRTLCHETFHSVQNYITSNIDWNRKVFQTSYFEELRQWKDNEDNYINAGLDGYEAYEKQPIEVTARAYAEVETAKILSYKY